MKKWRGSDKYMYNYYTIDWPQLVVESVLCEYIYAKQLSLYSLTDYKYMYVIIECK